MHHSVLHLDSFVSFQHIVVAFVIPSIQFYRVFNTANADNNVLT
jgi:hypothetical protein